MIEETTQDPAIESEFNWDKLEAQAADVDNINSPTTVVGESQKEPEPEVTSAELLSQAIQITADVVAPNWQIQPEESEQLGTVYGALLDKYMPDSGLDRFGLEISALLVTGLIIKSRSGIPLRKPDDKKPPLENSAEQVKSGVLEPKAVKHD